MSLLLSIFLVFQFIIHHKQRVEEINVKVEALTKDLISQKIFAEMEAVLLWDELPEEVMGNMDMLSILLIRKLVIYIFLPSFLIMNTLVSIFPDSFHIIKSLDYDFLTSFHTTE